MFDSIYFKNTVGDIMLWNTDPDPQGYFPIEEITFEIEGRSGERNRMQAQGTWPSYTYFGKMLIHISGRLLAQTPELLTAYKFRLMRMIMPIDMGYQGQRHVGQFYCQFAGMSEHFVTEVGLDGGPSIVNEAFYPSTAECELTLKSFNPYMVGVNSGGLYWVA